MLYSVQNCMTEWSYTSAVKYEDPFNDVELSRAFLFDPVNGTEHIFGQASADPDGTWVLQEGYDLTGRFVFPIYQDWVLVMEKKKGYKNEN